jgi:ribosomal protein L31
MQQLKQELCVLQHPFWLAEKKIGNKESRAKEIQ